MNEIKHVLFLTPRTVKPRISMMNLMDMPKTLKSPTTNINGRMHMNSATSPNKRNGVKIISGFANAAIHSKAPTATYGCSITGKCASPLARVVIYLRRIAYPSSELLSEH